MKAFPRNAIRGSCRAGLALWGSLRPLGPPPARWCPPAWPCPQGSHDGAGSGLRPRQGELPPAPGPLLRAWKPKDLPGTGPPLSPCESWPRRSSGWAGGPGGPPPLSLAQWHPSLTSETPRLLPPRVLCPRPSQRQTQMSGERCPETSRDKDRASDTEAQRSGGRPPERGSWRRPALWGVGRGGTGDLGAGWAHAPGQQAQAGTKPL